MNTNTNSVIIHSTILLWYKFTWNIFINISKTKYISIAFLDYQNVSLKIDSQNH